MIPKMDLAKLSYDELRELNDRVIAAIRVKQSERTKSFSIGDTVKFTARRGTVYTGIVTRRNKRTVSVHVKAGAGVPRPMNWRVAPSFLEKA